MIKILLYMICFLFVAAPLQASEDEDPFTFGDFEPQAEVSDETGNNIPPHEDEWEELDTSENGIISSASETEQNTPAAPTQPVLQTAPFVPSNPSQSAPEEKKNEPKIDPNQSLTETFSPTNEKKSALPIKVEGTWVDKLKDTNPLTAIKKATSGDTAKDGDEASLEGMIKSRRRRKGRSNASVFDISGIMLRMKVPQVEEIMQNRGFRKIYEKMEIPNFIRWRNEEKCRLDGVVGYERLDACVIERAKKDNHQYVDTIKFSKFDSQEEIEVRFTSNFTENKAYVITYKSLTPRIIGNSPKAMYLRNIKIYDFWKKINQKYGNPDNKEDVTWGLGGNKPFLKANTGYLKLEDPMFRELDYTRMSREDQRFINSDFYNF